MFLKNRLNRNIFLMYVITLLQGMVFYGSVSTLYRQAAGISLFSDYPDRKHFHDTDNFVGNPLGNCGR